MLALRLLFTAVVTVGCVWLLSTGKPLGGLVMLPRFGGVGSSRGGVWTLDPLRQAFRQALVGPRPALRRLEELEGIWAPVLMLTARGALEDRVSGTASPVSTAADDYLTT